MHDQTIEDRLRATLRSEADQLPFTITTDELQRRLAVRDRERTGRRIGLLAAGISAMLLGGALVLAINPFRGQQIATTPVPTTAPSVGPPQSAPAPAGPSTSPSAAVPSGEPQVDLALLGLDPDPESVDHALTTIAGDPSSTETQTSGVNLDHVRQSAREVGIKVVCIGPDQISLSWEVDQPDDPTAIARQLIPCDNSVATFHYDISARQPLIDDELLVFSTPRTSYRILVETFGQLNVPTPAGIPHMATPGGAVLLDRSDLVASTDTKTTRVGTVPPRQSYRIALVCTTEGIRGGESTATWSIGAEGHQDFVERGLVPCDGVPVGVSTFPGLAAAPTDMYVTAGPKTRWRIVVTSAIPASTFLPPALRMWTGNDLAGATSGPAHCVGHDGSGDSCGLDESARDGAPVVTAARGDHVSLRVDDAWTIEQAGVNVTDRAAIRKDPTSARTSEFAVLDDGSGRMTGSGDRMSLSLGGLDRGEWILTVTIQCRKGGHTFGATYQLPVRIE